VFNIVTITGGLILVTMLIGNIKVRTHATTLTHRSASSGWSIDDTPE
jgi:hypothetical protein